MNSDNSKNIDIKIKHMVCDRCVERVRDVLENSGFHSEEVNLGYARISVMEQGDWVRLKNDLYEAGFELVEDAETQRVEQIKAVLITHLNELQEGSAKPKKLSELLTSRIPWHYEGLSRSFRQATGVTIERYFILLKIEKVKELLEYGELTLAQIADRLGYSSSQHLSGQFKKETGVSVSEYRKNGKPVRKRLNEVG